MATDRAAEARAEAERRWRKGDDRASDFQHKVGCIKGFTQGVVWADANPKPADGNTSDGHHTFNELYEYRMLYNAHAAHGWLVQGIPVVKSWRHSDGEECFGGGWFIVTATLPAGQVSNHYEARHWGLFKVPEVELPPEWDGHTPNAAADRLRIEAEHANPQPRTITHDDMGAAYAAFMEAEGHPVRRFIVALKAAGIEVRDG